MFDYHSAPRFDADQGKCSGAGDENRTRMASLEGWGSAIELHPRTVMILNAEAFVAFTESGRQDSNLRSSAPKADALAATLRPGRPALPNVRDECRARSCAHQSSWPSPLHSDMHGARAPP
jgi:hypothetical protein